MRPATERPTMRFVRTKSAEQQGQLMQHRTRDLLIRQRTQSINAKPPTLIVRQARPNPPSPNERHDQRAEAAQTTP
jgi:hypothetical protein